MEQGQGKLPDGGGRRRECLEGQVKGTAQREVPICEGVREGKDGVGISKESCAEEYWKQEVIFNGDLPSKCPGKK